MKPQYSRYYTYIQPVFKNKFVQTYDVLIFGLISIIFLLIFAVRPTILTIISLNKTINNQQKILESVNKKSADLSKARTNYNELSSDLKIKVFGLVPNSTSIPCFLGYISDLANAEEATLSGIQIEPIELTGTSKCVILEETSSQDTSLSEADFSLSVGGNYSALVNFLEKLKTLNRLLTVETTTFSKGSESSLLNLSIKGKIYYFKTQ